jgi:2,4-dienoyl-CoA reductase (NADPH2)
MLPGGYGVEYMQEFCASLESGLIDAIDVTGGWHESPVPQISAHLPEGGFAFLAGAIKRVVNVPVIACNRINNGEIAEKILQSGLADFVGAGRAFLADAGFTNKIRAGKPFNKCQACNRGCIERILRGKSVCCAFNVETGLEYLTSSAATIRKKVLVIGGGPAGMEAAKVAALRGHSVILCAKEEHLGGLLSVACEPPHKKDIKNYVQTTAEELKTLGIDIRFSTAVDSQFIEVLKPDHVIVATGSQPIVASIQGLKEANVFFAEDVLRGNRRILSQVRMGKTVIIGGGAVGLETAHYLAEKAFAVPESMDFINKYVSKDLIKQIYVSLDITVVEMQKNAGQGMGATHRTLLQELGQLGTKIMVSTKVLFIKEKQIIIDTPNGKMSFPVDNIILAIGYKSVGKELIEYLDQNKYHYFVVGDAKEPRDVMEVLKDACKTVSEI